MNPNSDQKKILYLPLCETLNTAFDAGVVYEPLVIRYGIHFFLG